MAGGVCVRQPGEASLPLELALEGRDAGLMKALRKAGGVRQLARLLKISAPSVCQWRKIPRDRVHAVAEATELEPEDLRPDLAEFFEAERRAKWLERARARFGIASGMSPGATASLKRDRADAGTFDLLDLGLVVAALRFAAAERQLHVRSVIGAPPGGAGGSPTPEQSARSYGMALAVVVGRVSSETVAGVVGVTRQAVDNAAERYLRQRDGDDPELVSAGRVIERGRARAAKGSNEQAWEAERRFVGQLSGDES